MAAGNAYWLAGESFARPHSPLFAVEYVCAGNVTLLQHGKEYLIQSGEVYLLHKDTAHQYMTGPAGMVLKRYIQITGAGLDSYLRLLGLWDQDHIRPQQPQAFGRLLKRITTLLAHFSPDVESQVDVQLSCLVYQVLLELNRSLQSSLPASVRKAIAFINENLHRPISRQDICDYVGLSISYFTRIFFYMECSPFEYFLKQKFNWTAHLLKNTPLSVKEIAYRAGFEDPLYFSTQFKKRFGTSPQQYRQSEEHIPLPTEDTLYVKREGL